MEIERAIERLRLRLLRLLAGLLAVVSLAMLGPASGRFANGARRFVLSILIRAEAAAQMLVIAQARLLAKQRGSRVERQRLFDLAGVKSLKPTGKTLPSLGALKRRLNALRALLEDMPRQGLRLLLKAERNRTDHPTVTRRMMEPSAMQRLFCQRLAANRIERPPDKDPAYFAIAT